MTVSGMRLAKGMMEKQFDVFISYATSDGIRAARRVQNHLETHGVRVYCDLSREDEIRVGDDVPSSLRQIIQDSRYFIPVITTLFGESPWTRAETNAAVDGKIAIVPVLAVRPERVQWWREPPPWAAALTSARAVDLAAGDSHARLEQLAWTTAPSTCLIGEICDSAGSGGRGDESDRLTSRLAEWALGGVQAAIVHHHCAYLARLAGDLESAEVSILLALDTVDSHESPVAVFQRIAAMRAQIEMDHQRFSEARGVFEQAITAVARRVQADGKSLHRRERVAADRHVLGEITKELGRSLVEEARSSSRHTRYSGIVPSVPRSGPGDEAPPHEQLMYEHAAVLYQHAGALLADSPAEPRAWLEDHMGVLCYVYANLRPANAPDNRRLLTNENEALSQSTRENLWRRAAIHFTASHKAFCRARLMEGIGWSLHHMGELHSFQAGDSVDPRRRRSHLLQAESHLRRALRSFAPGWEDGAEGIVEGAGLTHAQLFWVLRALEKHKDAGVHARRAIEFCNARPRYNELATRITSALEP